MTAVSGGAQTATHELPGVLPRGVGREYLLDERRCAQEQQSDTQRMRHSREGGEILVTGEENNRLLVNT